MAFPFLAAALSLSEMVPVITRWFKNTDKGSAPSQMITEKVVELAKKVTGCADSVGAVRSLQQDPEALLKFQQAVLKLDHDLEKTFIKDIQNARARDIEVISSKRRNLRADIMVVAAIFGLLLCLLSLILLQGNLAGEVICFISTVAGVFGTCLRDAYAFEFGATRGYKGKDIAQLLESLHK